MPWLSQRLPGCDPVKCPDIHHMDVFVCEHGMDLVHRMQDCLFHHMPVVVIAFFTCCQILAFANKGHMFRQRKAWQLVKQWFCNLGRVKEGKTSRWHIIEKCMFESRCNASSILSLFVCFFSFFLFIYFLLYFLSICYLVGHVVSEC